jgi:RimJ/RimL family protein N-acetyltransferase
MSKIIETDRLILRTWNDDDLQPMLAINQDPKVMEYFPELQDLETTKKLIVRINSHFEKYGYTIKTFMYIMMKKYPHKYFQF